MYNVWLPPAVFNPLTFPTMNDGSLLAEKAQFLTVDYVSTLGDSDAFTAEIIGNEYELTKLYFHPKLVGYDGKPKLMAKVRRSTRINDWFADSFMTKFVIDEIEPGLTGIEKGLTFAEAYASEFKLPSHFMVTGFEPGLDKQGNPMYRRDALSALKLQKLLKGDYEAYRSKEQSPAKSEAYRTISANVTKLFLDNLCTKPGAGLTPENEIKYRLGTLKVRVIAVV